MGDFKDGARRILYTLRRRREGMHPHPAHTSYTPTHTHMPTHTWATNSTYTQPVNQCRLLQLQLSATYLCTNTHTHILVQWSPPTLRLRQGNDSVPLCFPQRVCVCMHMNACTFLCECVYMSVYICCICVHSCHSVNVFRVCVCVCVYVCECGCGQAQSSSRQLRGNPHQLPYTTL